MGALAYDDRAPAPMAIADANAIFDTYSRCVLSEDIDGWIDLWADDPVVKLPPNAPTLFGREEIAGALRSSMDEVRWQQVDVTVDEVVSDGDLAFARGTCILGGDVKETGQPLTFPGKFLTVFMRQPDGSWKIFRDVYNFDS